MGSKEVALPYGENMWVDLDMNEPQRSVVLTDRETHRNTAEVWLDADTEEFGVRGSGISVSWDSSLRLINEIHVEPTSQFSEYRLFLKIVHDTDGLLYISAAQEDDDEEMIITGGVTHESGVGTYVPMEEGEEYHFTYELTLRDVNVRLETREFDGWPEDVLIVWEGDEEEHMVVRLGMPDEVILMKDLMTEPVGETPAGYEQLAEQVRMAWCQTIYPESDDSYDQ